jgi:hypothetical protein
MERIDALATLERITRHWAVRLSASQHDHWMETLTNLDATAAGSAFVRLMRSATLPTPAAFMAEAQQHQPSRPSDWCVRCGNTGVITCDDHPRHWHDQTTMPRLASEPDTCICNIARPCDCASGGVARAWMERHSSQRAGTR